jgi:hypothetical protein
VEGVEEVAQDLPKSDALPLMLNGFEWQWL